MVGTGHDGELWNADGVELLVDPLHDRSAAPDADDRHVIVTAAGDVLEARGAGAGEDRSIVMGSTVAVTTQGTVNSGAPASGYRVVAAVPWSGIGTAPAAGAVLGLDLALNDLDGTMLTSADWAAEKPFAQPLGWRAITLAAPAASGMPSDGVGGNGAGPEAGGGNVAPGSVHAGCSLGGGDGAPSLLCLVGVAALFVVRRRQRPMV